MYLKYVEHLFSIDIKVQLSKFSKHDPRIIQFSRRVN